MGKTKNSALIFDQIINSLGEMNLALFLESGILYKVQVTDLRLQNFSRLEIHLTFFGDFLAEINQDMSIEYNSSERVGEEIILVGKDEFFMLHRKNRIILIHPSGQIILSKELRYKFNKKVLRHEDLICG